MRFYTRKKRNKSFKLLFNYFIKKKKNKKLINY